LTGIGPEPIGDIPVPGASAFGGTSDVTTLLAQSMVAQQAQGEDLRRQVADIRAESSTADLAKAVNALRRTIDRLNTRIETLESTSGTTFNSYGTLYAQGSKDLSGSLDVARQNATALRLGS
jgi:predicted  nucleic acid-binding Zn-ribbon protein